VVEIGDIPDFPGQPGQRPAPGVPSGVTPAAVVLVTAPLDREYLNIALNPAAVDAFIAGEVAADRAKSITVERWSPWAPLSVQLGYAVAAPYNYARFDLGGRHWYAFLSAQYLNLTDTTYLVEPDEWTTYHPSIGYSMVDRGHVAVAASQDDTYGAQYLTAPEPIDAPPVRGVSSATLLGSTPSDWTVLVISANNLNGGTGYPFWDKHVKNDDIIAAANLATSATIDSSGTVQTTIDEANYPWQAQPNDDSAPGGGTPTNGYVPAAYRADLVGAPDTLSPAKPGPVQAEANTAAAYAALKAAHPGATIGGPAGGYWSRALDVAVHNNPGHYGVIDTGLSPVGQSPHGLGIRINISGISESDAADFGFSAYNAYTYTYNGPYAWESAPPTTNDVYSPKVEPAPVSTIDGVAAGGAVYLFTPEGFAQYMTIMQGAPWVTSGIIDVRLVPSWVVGEGGDATFSPDIPSLDPSDPMWDIAANIPVYVGKVESDTANETVLAGWRETVLTDVGAQGWTKLVTSQFTDLLVGNGETLVSFRPDQWQADDLAFVAVSGAAHGDPSIRLLPEGYNNGRLGSQMGLDAPVGGQAGLAHSGFGISAANVANQNLGPYLNAYSAHQQWLSNFQNKQLAVHLGLENIQLQAGVQGITTALGGATSAAGGALGGGGAKGAINGAAGGLLGAAANIATAQVVANNAITMLDIAQDGSFDIAAFQLGLNGKVAVDTFDTWYQSLQAASGGGSPHNLASSWRAIVAQAFRVIVAMPTAERIKALVSEWRRFGYMIGQAFTPDRLDVMTHWSYWKLSETTILGDLPQSSRDSIARAFSRGVTVWGTVSEIGTEPDNEPRSGVSY